MTEDEAKTKWCPFMKGEQGDGESSATCVGSACMAWRTREKSTGVTTTTNDGFCGLAGRPQ